MQETCEIVSQLFNVVITIIDTDFIRGEGTGEYEAEVGKKVVTPNIFESVMEKNDTLIINRPGEDPRLCRLRKQGELP